MDKRARQIILEQQREEQKALGFRNLYQDVANFMLPRENQITSERPSGEDKSIDIYDPTAIMDLDDMVSSLIQMFFPPGEQSFAITVKNRNLVELDHIKRWLVYASQRTHEELFASNFMLQLTETLTSIVGFGTGNLYSEFMVEDNRPLKLNFKAWDVSHYTIKQNYAGDVDTVILKFPFTARQAVQKWGEDAGEQVYKDSLDLETESKRHWFIHWVSPRAKRKISLSDTKNWPIESLYVNVKEEKVIEEDGYEQIMPYSVARWKKSPSEKYGRGQGTVALAGVKTQQTMWQSFVEYGNKSVNPAREVLQSFEGRLRVTPGAQNIVSELPSQRPIELGSQNYQFAEKAYVMQANVIHRAFFVDVFAPLSNLPGDRRTTVEIYQRVAQAMKKLASPYFRLQTELLTPTIERCVLLLIKNGRIENPPAELLGQNFGIEYVGELALAIRDKQARAFERMSAILERIEPIFPGVSRETINMDRTLTDIAFTYGMKVEHLNTEDEKAAIRQKHAQDEAEQKAAMMAQIASKGYSDVTKAPEAGSPAEAVMGAEV